MKNTLAVLAGAGLLTISQVALSNSGESYQERCEQEATEEKVEQDLLESYMSDCIRYYQDLAGVGADEQPEIDQPLEADEEKSLSSEQ